MNVDLRSFQLSPDAYESLEDCKIEEPDDEEILRELAALGSGGMEGNETTAPIASQANFTMLRFTSKGSFDDFGAENAVLTPEDEENPELLAELRALTDGPAPLEVKGSFDLNTELEQLKKAALQHKREGNLDLARAELQKFEQLEKLKQVPTTVTKSKSVPQLSAKPSTQPLEQETPPAPESVNPNAASVYREIIGKLREQAACCAKFVDYYTKTRRDSEASLYAQRKQAFELDLLQIRARLKANAMPPTTETVTMQLESLSTATTPASDFPPPPDDEMHLYFRDFKIVKAKHCPLKPEREYQLRISYEISPTTDALLSASFTMLGLEQNRLGPLVIKVNRRDIRVLKAVEYKKLRLEVVRPAVSLSASSLFSSLLRSITGEPSAAPKKVYLTGAARLDGLLKQDTVQISLELMETEADGSRRSSVPVATVCIVGLVSSGLSPLAASKPTVSRTEKWLIIPEFGHCTANLFPTAKTAHLAESASQRSVQSLVELSTSTASLSSDFLVPVGQIKSFEVIEHELAKLQAREETVYATPSLMDRQVALESLRDSLQTQVEFGELSMEDYLATVRKSLDEAKMAAVRYRKDGNLDAYKAQLKHVEIMQQEIAEAEAGSDEVPDSKVS